MRRENSTFKTSFVSNEGTKLFNNDYYGSAELDRYACYVAADGLESGDIESASAQIAVQAAIAAFHERPSISKGAMRRYVKAAHKALRQNSGQLSLRASITVVVTDYQKVRCSWAGNTRFYLYRAGRLMTENSDHSLSRQMVERGELPIDKIASHEERDNLSRYAGQPKSLSPQITKKIKLQNGDVIMLITRGAWERCDTGDIKAAIDSSETHPELALDGIERLLLDPHPEEVDNYTASAVFIDKVYVDPNRGKKIKKILAITIPIFVVLVAVLIVLLVLRNNRLNRIQEMNTAFISAVEFISDENHPRAAEELETTLRLATEVRDWEFHAMADLHQRLTTAIIHGDELLASGDFEGAQSAFLIAQDRSRFTDNLGQAYIERRLTQIGGLLSVRDLILLGDILAANGNFAQAEQRYLDARLLASGINDAAGRSMAMEALQNLTALQDREAAMSRDAAAQQSQTLQEATEMETAGDRAVAEVDLAGARLFYTVARERFLALGDAISVVRIDEKLQALLNTQEQADGQTQTALRLITEGDRMFDAGNYVEAQVRYIQARNIFARLQDSANLADVLARIDITEIRIRGAEEARDRAAAETSNPQTAPAEPTNTTPPPVPPPAPYQTPDPEPEEDEPEPEENDPEPEEDDPEPEDESESTNESETESEEESANG